MITRIGFNYFVPEQSADLAPDEAKRQGFGIFSARYGNIYTPRQLNQLLKESQGSRTRHERVWERNGAFHDPYRPNMFPGGLSSPDEVASKRQEHLGYVDDTFRGCDLFVFTLGLTEGWASKVDGSVFPLAPGVVAGEFDDQRHVFFNASIDETRRDLFEFIDGLRALNEKVRILLTVSPVPLIATFEDRHVLASTIYSKSVLRVAAQEATDTYPFVDYFPSYEIITGSPTRGPYFADDMREVNSLGVSHAMRCFLETYTERSRTREPARAPEDDLRFRRASEIVCDEEEIEASLR